MAPMRWAALGLALRCALAAKCGMQCSVDTDCVKDENFASSCQHCVRRQGVAKGSCDCSSVEDADIAGDTIATECCGLQPFDCCDRCISGKGKATTACVASVWLNTSTRPGYAPGTCVYKSSTQGFFKGSGQFQPSTAGSRVIFPEYPRTVYRCDAASLKCVAVENTTSTGDWWADEAQCGAVCETIADPCAQKTSCGDCLADASCGWCSTNVLLRNGRQGGQCASTQSEGKLFKCPAQFGPHQCTGTDSPVQRIAVGSTSPSDFLAKFRATVLQGLEIPVPADFGRLAGAPSVAPGGSYAGSVTPAGVPAFLGQVPEEVRAKLEYAIPALMFAHGGDLGTMLYQSFNVKDGAGELQLVFAGVSCGGSAAKGCDVAFVFAGSSAQVLQQYTTYHVGCCDCDVGGCGTWIHFGCHGCDRQTTRPDTADELARIRQGLQATIHDSFATSFPAHLPPAVATLSRSLDTSAWDLLKGVLRKFLNRADTQQILARKSPDATVQKVQTAVTEIAEDVSVLKVPQVALEDVGSVVQAGLGEVPVPADIVNAMIQWVQTTAKGAQGNTSGAVQWTEKEVISSDGTTLAYFTVRMYFDPKVSPYVDLVTCAYKNAMHIEKLTITTTSQYRPDGSLDINITTQESPITGQDLQQFEVLWKYAVDDAVLKALEGKAKGYVSPRMRVFPFRLKATAGANQVGGAFDSLVGIITESSKLWQGIVSAFGTHTSQKIQIISQNGFTKFNEATDTYTVPGVQTADIDAFFDAVMSEYDAKTRDATKQHVKALLFSHSVNDTATWLRQHVTYGEDQASGGCGVDHGCAEFFVVHVNPHLAENANHFAMCTYKTDFVLAPTIELITTSTSYLGGIFSSDHDEIRQLPPVWTPEDETALKGFMAVQCQYMTSLALGVQGLQPPVFPVLSNGATIALV